jgi:hypothetical protein
MYLSPRVLCFVLIFKMWLERWWLRDQLTRLILLWNHLCVNQTWTGTQPSIQRLKTQSNGRREVQVITTSINQFITSVTEALSCELNLVLVWERFFFGNFLRLHPSYKVYFQYWLCIWIMSKNLVGRQFWTFSKDLLEVWLTMGLFDLVICGGVGIAIFEIIHVVHVAVDWRVAGAGVVVSTAASSSSNFTDWSWDSSRPKRSRCNDSWSENWLSKKNSIKSCSSNSSRNSYRSSYGGRGSR